MRAYVLAGPGEGEMQEVPTPVAAPGEVVIDVERVGVCGTDVEFFTDAATSVKWELQGVRSEAVFAIAICGRPVNASPGTPRRIHARWI